MSLSYRENTLAVFGASHTTGAGSYDVTAYPVGAIASAGSSGTTITVDAGHSFRAGDKYLLGPGGANTFSGTDTVQSVTATTVVMGQSVTVSSGDALVNMGPDTGTSAPNYDASPVAIYSDADGSTAVSNSRVTCDGTTGEFSYYHKGDGRFWELVRNSAAAVVDVVKGFGAVAGRYNVADFGAAGDATTDDTNAIQNVCNAVATLGGAVHFPVGTFLVGSGNTVDLDSQIKVTGDGDQSVIQKPAADTANVFTADAKTDIIIRDLQFAKDGANSASDGAAIRLIGACKDVVIENVLIDMFASGVDVEGSEGASASTAERISCRRVHVKNSTVPTAGQYGFNFGDAIDISVNGCIASQMWLDGMKCRRMTFGIKVTDCVFKSNGVSTTGDGIDCYAGGDEITLVNLTCESNQGAGINIKTGDLNRTGASAIDIYGICRNVLVSGCGAISNTGKGIILNRSSAAATTDPLISHVVLSGCYSGENGAEGIYVRARNVVMQGCISRKNDATGIIILESSLDVRVDACMVIANSQAAAGSVHGIEIQGNRCSVDNCIIQGKDADIINENGDYAAETAYQNRPIRVTDAATEVYIGSNNVYENHSADDTVKTDDVTDDMVVVDQIVSTDLVTSGIQAGPGSFARRWNAAGNPMLYLKTTAYDATGWTPVPHWGVSPDTLDDTGTPSVKQNWTYKTGGTTAITDFDDGLRGQTIKILCAAGGVTITHNVLNIDLAGGVDFDMVNGDTLTLNMFNDGVWHEVARAYNDGPNKAGVTAGITADVGSAQGNGALTTEVNEISTCANIGDAVTLPAAVAGLKIVVFNNGANSADVFPASGDDCGGGANTAVAVAAGSMATFHAYDSTNWRGHIDTIAT